MSEVKGDLLVGRKITSRRSNEGFSAETLTTTRNIVINDFKWLHLVNATTQNVVLPDATTLPNGWEIFMHVPSSSGASVNVSTYHISSPVLLKNILADKTYRFVLLDNGTSAGKWLASNVIGEEVVIEKYVKTFNATTDWGSASGGYYSQQILQTTHNRGLYPQVIAQELSGSDFITVEVDRVLVAANGDITVRVPEVPNLRFAGRILIL